MTDYKEFGAFEARYDSKMPAAGSFREKFKLADTSVINKRAFHNQDMYQKLTS